MKRYLPFLFVLLFPLSIFAQPRDMDGTSLLKRLGLNDSQITQVESVQKSTEEGVRANMTHIRLVQAQIEEALLATAPDTAAINALIDRKGALRVEIEKSLMSARLQLIKLLGRDKAESYLGFVMRTLHPRFRGGPGMGEGMGEPMGMGRSQPRMMGGQDGPGQGAQN